ncbi:hypothetical protein Tco_1142778 [Tanacetum coccineum]
MNPRRFPEADHSHRCVTDGNLLFDNRTLMYHQLNGVKGVRKRTDCRKTRANTTGRYTQGERESSMAAAALARASGSACAKRYIGNGLWIDGAISYSYDPILGTVAKGGWERGPRMRKCGGLPDHARRNQGMDKDGFIKHNPDVQY